MATLARIHGDPEGISGDDEGTHGDPAGIHGDPGGIHGDPGGIHVAIMSLSLIEKAKCSSKKL